MAKLPSDLAIFSPPVRRCSPWHQIRTNGWPVAASLWAISFSWCGKMLSTPPQWMSNDSPSSAMLIAEHSMCQPGRPRPSVVSQPISSVPTPFHSAKSRASSLSYSSASTRPPAPATSPSARTPESLPYGGNAAMWKYTLPSLRYVTPDASMRPMSATISAMYSVARG